MYWWFEFSWVLVCPINNIIRIISIVWVLLRHNIIVTDTDGFEIPSLGMGGSEQGEGIIDIPAAEELKSSSFKVTA